MTTDFRNTLPIPLSQARFEKIQADGMTALALINAAGSGPPPVGVWRASTRGKPLRLSFTLNPYE